MAASESIASALTSTWTTVTTSSATPWTEPYPMPTVPFDECNLSDCPIQMAQITYDPNLAGNAILLAVFSACLLANVLLTVRYRTWGYGAAMILGCNAEVIGYVGRVQMHYNPFPLTPFMMYLCCVTVASVFYTAGIYLCLARIVVACGESLSFLRPRTYTFLFVSIDFICLLLQGGGGAIVVVADDEHTGNLGLQVMQAGLAIQVVGLVTFITLSLIFAFRCFRHPERLDSRFVALRSSRRWKLFLLALSFATMFMLTRCAFRVAELSAGFHSAIWYSELDYMVLEGAMISLCAILMTSAGHIGVGFGGYYRQADFKLRVKKKKDRFTAYDESPGSLSK